MLELQNDGRFCYVLPQTQTKLITESFFPGWDQSSQKSLDPTQEREPGTGERNQLEEDGQDQEGENQDQDLTQGDQSLRRRNQTKTVIQKLNGRRKRKWMVQEEKKIEVMMKMINHMKNGIGIEKKVRQDKKRRFTFQMFQLT